MAKKNPPIPESKKDRKIIELLQKVSSYIMFLETYEQALDLLPILCNTDVENIKLIFHRYSRNGASNFGYIKLRETAKINYICDGMRHENVKISALFHKKVLDSLEIDLSINRPEKSFLPTSINNLIETIQKDRKEKGGKN
jgi:hypothetical protein